MGYGTSTSAENMPPLPSGGAEAKALLFPTDLNLSKIISRIYRTLYSASALRKSDAELLKTIRELDGDLEEWKGCLSASDMLIASLPNKAQSESVIDVRYIMLRLQYHHCAALIHQASHRCKAGIGDFRGMGDGICLSQELSLEASRTLILFLQAAKRALPGEFFWYVYILMII